MSFIVLAKRAPLSPFCAPFQRASEQSLLVKRIFSRASSTNSSEEDFVRARTWYAKLLRSPLPHDIGEVTYSRSSGPGGQNVNKVNSKAQLRVPLDSLLPLVPSILHHGIRSSRYYAEKTNSLLIQADDSRKQHENKDSCYRRLTQVVMDVYRSTVPGETSPEQKDKVRKLQKLENESRLKSKKMQSSKKAFRSRGFGE